MEHRQRYNPGIVDFLEVGKLNVHEVRCDHDQDDGGIRASAWGTRNKEDQTGGQDRGFPSMPRYAADSAANNRVRDDHAHGKRNTAMGSGSRARLRFVLFALAPT